MRTLRPIPVGLQHSLNALSQFGTWLTAALSGPSGQRRCAIPVGQWKLRNPWRHRVLIRLVDDSSTRLLGTTLIWAGFAHDLGVHDDCVGGLQVSRRARLLILPILNADVVHARRASGHWNVP